MNPTTPTAPTTPTIFRSLSHSLTRVGLTALGLGLVLIGGACDEGAFGADSDALALREGFALFRLAADAFRRSGSDWAVTIDTGLLLTQEALERPH